MLYTQYNIRNTNMASEWIGLSVLMEMLGTDANGVRRVARDAGAERYKLGAVEVYDKDVFFASLSKKSGKVKKRVLTPEHKAKMMKGKADKAKRLAEKKNK
jgi:hypothetical protein